MPSKHQPSESEKVYHSYAICNSIKLTADVVRVTSLVGKLLRNSKILKLTALTFAIIRAITEFHYNMVPVDTTTSLKGCFNVNRSFCRYNEVVSTLKLPLVHAG